jgi:putative NADH-flavin reductase
MNSTLFGATGNSGARILKELLSRGHQVTAIVRDPAKLPSQTGLTVRKGDLSDVAQIAEAVRGTEAVVSAYGPGLNSPGDLVPATKRLVAGLKQAGVQRLLMVGGAGSLEVAPGVQLIDSGYLPQEWMPISLAHREALEVLKASDLDWTSLSPAGYFEPGQRTGKFRLGKDNLIANEKGESRISMEDYAIALVDELESHAHPRQRFSVGY